jgi:RNA-binding protein 5/10
MMTSMPLSKQKPAFPPNFDTNGGSYVFQAQSGYFFEPVSDYYYCPKSKLYYCATDGIYYRYDHSFVPPFRRYDPPVPLVPASNTSSGTDDGMMSPSPSNPGEATAAELARKPVVLSITTMSKGAKGKPVSTTSAPAASAAPSAPISMSLPSSKKISLNLAKWNTVKEEDVEEGKANEKAPANLATVVAPPEAVGDNQAASAVTPAATPAPSGPPFVCLLCRRQFNSAEQLIRHENESKLHAENLAKQQAAAQEPAYRDRAAERRAVQGESIPPPGTRVRSDSVDASAPSSSNRRVGTEVSAVLATSSEAAPVFMDSVNPGNVLLRKMGWSEGKGLGKEGTQIVLFRFFHLF